MKYTPLLNKKQNKLKHTALKTKRSNTLNTVSSLKQIKSLDTKNIKLKKHNEKAKEKWDIVREKALHFIKVVLRRQRIIRRLREKIEANPSEPKYVHTKWGVGYYFQA